MRDPRVAGLLAIENQILEGIGRGEGVDAFALMLLVGRYAGGHDQLADALGLALSRALATYQVDTGADARAAWLILFASASQVSDDERLREAAAWLVEELRRTWIASTSVDETAPGIDACLRLSQLTPDPGATGAPGAPETRALAAEAIDALERMVSGAYKPGKGMGGGPRTQVRAASALLTAYEVSYRLPYSMLAEELMQGIGRSGGDLAADFMTSCEAARVLARLARLHDDADYLKAAVVAPNADYRRDAAGLLAEQSPHVLGLGAGGSIYAVALIELEFPDWYGDSSRD